MTTFLRAIGVLSIIGAILGAMGNLPNAGAAIGALSSGVVSAAILFWMAAVRDDVEDAADTLEEISQTLKAMAKQAGAVLPAPTSRPCPKCGEPLPITSAPVTVCRKCLTKIDNIKDYERLQPTDARARGGKIE